jgi:hypothetical protein
MASVTRTIGLSLGADICWPICYEQILGKLDLAIPWQGDTVKLATERVTIEPFDLRQPCKYDVVLDRLTHWYHTSREWIKKAILMDGLYVLNNPWSVQSQREAHDLLRDDGARACPSRRRGWCRPRTTSRSPTCADAQALRQAVRPDGAIGKQLGYPLFMKPYDGGGWRASPRSTTRGAAPATRRAASW